MAEKQLVRDFNDVDIIALTIIVGCFILRILGIDGLVDMSIAAIIGFYFGGKFNHK